ncbi:MAG: hypothetical protein Ct9H300mP4_03880 [Gammaproteobacteria bacterium]|nr:MAG: hypothetical protein Ct9H300mP4_03880 [Gammaproteobacteria bacterium]
MQNIFFHKRLDGMLEQTGNPFDEYLRLVYEDSVFSYYPIGPIYYYHSDLT